VKSVFVALLLCAFACGEKRNPDRCCVDEADCAAIGLPNGSNCQPGELCRGNECVEQICSMSSQCDLAAPYCEDSHCAEMCDGDTSCPGAEQMNKPFCVSGGCVQCRDTGDCEDRVCVNGSCTGCAADGECASGVCVIATGLCASSTDVAFVTPTGSPTSNCTTSQPCTLARALSIDPPRKSIKLADGVYQNASTITLEGMRSFSGVGLETTRITNTGGGPVFVLGATSDISFDRLEIFGATNGANLGVGIHCSGGGKVAMTQVRVAQNASHGVQSDFCTTSITESLLKQNGGLGARLTSDMMPPYLVDRVRVSDNVGGGIRAEGVGTIRSSIMSGNLQTTLELVGTFQGRPDVSFMTIIGSVFCRPTLTPAIPVANVLVQGTVQNQVTSGIDTRVCSMSKCFNLFGNNADGCTRVEDVNLDADYHLPVGQINSAIDTAGGGSGTLDIDGEPRPKGAAADVGADESF
jgi:hypothetical protein